MLNALILAFRQFDDPRVQRLLLRCVLLAAGTFVVLVAVVAAGLAAIDATGIAWLDAGIVLAGSGMAVVVAWLLFPVVVALTLNLFADEVAEAVEAQHYPDLPPAAGLALEDTIRVTVRFTAVAVALNLLALPLYLLPGPNLVVFVALNGYLLGREYFELVAQRRMSPLDAARCRRAVRARVWAAGAMIALLLVVPLLNLVAPVVATAFMVHLFERWRRRMPLAEVARQAGSRAPAGAFDRRATEVFDFQPSGR
jgi:CysZ protein